MTIPRAIIVGIIGLTLGVCACSSQPEGIIRRRFQLNTTPGVVNSTVNSCVDYSRLCAGEKGKFVAPPEIIIYDYDTTEQILIDSSDHLKALRVGKGNNGTKNWCWDQIILIDRELYKDNPDPNNRVYTNVSTVDETCVSRPKDIPVPTKYIPLPSGFRK